MLSEQRSDVIKARQSWSGTVSLFAISPVVIHEGKQSLSAVHHLVKHFQIMNLEGALCGATYPMVGIHGRLGVNA